VVRADGSRHAPVLKYSSKFFGIPTFIGIYWNIPVLLFDFYCNFKVLLEMSIVDDNFVNVAVVD